MAGTLTVQNLQGPSSGANANKVLIPSGQTLDVSGGTLVPSAGAVVQVKTHSFLGGGAFSSTGFTSISAATFSFTPKFATSKLYISANYAYNLSQSPAGNGGFSIRTFHDGTSLFNGLTAGYNYYDSSTPSHYGMLSNNFELVDAVNTSPRNITADCRVYTGTNTLYIGYSSADAESVITVMEIAQ